MSDEDICIDFDEIDEVGDAYEVTIDGTEYYFPKSLCRVYYNNKKIYVPEWILIKEDLA